MCVGFDFFCVFLTVLIVCFFIYIFFYCDECVSVCYFIFLSLFFFLLSLFSSIVL